MPARTLNMSVFNYEIQISLATYIKICRDIPLNHKESTEAAEFANAFLKGRVNEATVITATNYFYIRPLFSELARYSNNRATSLPEFTSKNFASLDVKMKTKEAIYYDKSCSIEQLVELADSDLVVSHPDYFWEEGGQQYQYLTLIQFIQSAIANELVYVFGEKTCRGVNEYSTANSTVVKELENKWLVEWQSFCEHYGTENLVLLKSSSKSAYFVNDKMLGGDLYQQVKDSVRGLTEGPVGAVPDDLKFDVVESPKGQKLSAFSQPMFSEIFAAKNLALQKIKKAPQMKFRKGFGLSETFFLLNVDYRRFDKERLLAALMQVDIDRNVSFAEALKSSLKTLQDGQPETAASVYSDFTNVMNYLLNTWADPYRAQLKAFTDKIVK